MEQFSVSTSTGEILTFVAHGRPEMVSRHLAKGIIYEHELLEFTRHVVGSGGIFVDCGANIGTHSVYWAVCCKAEKVYAIEPVLANRDLLEQNCRLNSSSTIVDVFACGLSDEPGTASHNHRPRNMAAICLVDGGPIQMRTVDSFAFKTVTLLKIDCEAHSKRVLLGAQHTIRLHRPALVVIETSAHESNDVADLFDSLGYGLTRTFGKMTNCYAPVELLARIPV